MGEEFNALVQNYTWRLLPCRDDMNQLSCKWVYRIKYNSDGSIECQKARWVIRGFGSFVGLDYNESFSPIMKRITIRIVLALTVTLD